MIFFLWFVRNEPSLVNNKAYKIESIIRLPRQFENIDLHILDHQNLDPQISTRLKSLLLKSRLDHKLDCLENRDFDGRFFEGQQRLCM